MVSPLLILEEGIFTFGRCLKINIRGLQKDRRDLLQ